MVQLSKQSGLREEKTERAVENTQGGKRRSVTQTYLKCGLMSELAAGNQYEPVVTCISAVLESHDLSEITHYLPQSIMCQRTDGVAITGKATFIIIIL